MRGICTTNVENLPDAKSVLTGTQIPEWVSAAGRQLYEQAAEMASSEFPQFQGERRATYTDPATGEMSKLTPDELAGLELLRQGEDTYQTYVDDAKAMADQLGQGYTGATRDELVGDEFTLDTAQPFLDIYQRATDAAVRQAQQDTDRGLIQDASEAARMGAFGGSRLGLREAQTVAEGARTTGDLRAQAAAQGLTFAGQRFDADREARFAAEDRMRSQFETEEAARVRAAEELQSYAPLVQGLTEQAASGLLTAGEAQRMLDQMALDMAYADYVEQREFPFQMINFAQGALQGVPYETRTIGLEEGTQYVQSPSIYGQTLGGLGSLASAYYLGSR